MTVDRSAVLLFVPGCRAPSFTPSHPPKHRKNQTHPLLHPDITGSNEYLHTSAASGHEDGDLPTLFLGRHGPHQQT